jgi:hypothetical protein
MLNIPNLNKKSSQKFAGDLEFGSLQVPCIRQNIGKTKLADGVEELRPEKLSVLTAAGAFVRKNYLSRRRRGASVKNIICLADGGKLRLKKISVPLTAGSFG